jgi:hypothetical protein
MRKIDTLADLKAEKKRLKFRKLVLEAELKQDLAGFKETLAPLAIVTRGAKTLLSSKDNSIVGSSFGNVANFLAKNILLRNSGLITRLLVPYIIKNATSNFAENNKSKILGWLEQFISRLGHKSLVKEGLAP